VNNNHAEIALPNLKEFKKGESSMRKIKAKIKERIDNKGLLYLSLSFVCLIIRLISPIIFIRFGSLRSNKIGPLALIPELYLCEKEHNIQPNKSIDIFHEGRGKSDHICNRHLLEMWRRTLLDRKNVFINEVAKYFHYLFIKVPFGNSHIINTINLDRDVYGLMEDSDIHLEFRSIEVSQAQSDIRNMGINEKDSWVCILNRTQKYTQETFPDKKWDHNSFRDCKIQNYVLAADELTKSGHFVIRMGTLVGDLMKTDNPKIIEYDQNGYRTELLDIYLSANCHFFVSCGSGLDSVAMVFRRPVVWVNFHHLEYINSWPSNCITIFRKHWLSKDKRFMTVREILESGAGRYLSTEAYKKDGIELIENTPEEIHDVVIEMDERLKGTWKTTKEDEELQKRFWSLFKPNDLNKVFNSRIGEEFLRQNQQLLA